MRFFDGAAVDRALSYPALVDVLEAAFRTGAIAPLRHHHAIALDGRPEATLLLMPAWQASAPGSAIAGRYLGVKSVDRVPRQRHAAASRPCSAPTCCSRPRPARRWRSWMRRGSRPGARLRPRRSPAATSPAPMRARLADGRRRRAGAPPHPRARLGAADPRGGDLEPLGAPRPERWPRASPIPASPSPSPTTWRRPCALPTSSPRPRSRPSRWSAAPGSRPARTSTASAPTSPACARPTTRSCAAPASSSTRAPAPSARPATSCSRSRPA